MATMANTPCVPAINTIMMTTRTVINMLCSFNLSHNYTSIQLGTDYKIGQ